MNYPGELIFSTSVRTAHRPRQAKMQLILFAFVLMVTAKQVDTLLGAVAEIAKTRPS